MSMFIHTPYKAAKLLNEVGEKTSHLHVSKWLCWGKSMISEWTLGRCWPSDVPTPGWPRSSQSFQHVAPAQPFLEVSGKLFSQRYTIRLSLGGKRKSTLLFWCKRRKLTPRVFSQCTSKNKELDACRGGSRLRSEFVYHQVREDRNAQSEDHDFMLDLRRLFSMFGRSLQRRLKYRLNIALKYLTCRHTNVNTQLREADSFYLRNRW